MSDSTPCSPRPRAKAGIVRCDACPVLVPHPARPSPAPATAMPTWTASSCASIRWCCWPSPISRAVAFVDEAAMPGAGELGRQRRRLRHRASAPPRPIPTTSPRPSSSAEAVDGVDHGHRRDRGHLQLLRRQGEDRHRPLSRPEQAAVARQGRGGGPRHHGRIRLADAVAGRRASPGPAAAKKEGVVTCDALLALVQPRGRSSLRSTTARPWWCEADRPPVINGKREERMRVGCGSAAIGMFAHAMAGLCRRSDRGRRPHHRRR